MFRLLDESCLIFNKTTLKGSSGQGTQQNIKTNIFIYIKNENLHRIRRTLNGVINKVFTLLYTCLYISDFSSIMYTCKGNVVCASYTHEQLTNRKYTRK